MKRTILFKAKRVDNGEWIQGDLCQNQSPKVFIFPFDGMDSPDNYEVIPETVSQFTGLINNNGDKIWEGDMLNCSGLLYIVKWCGVMTGWIGKYEHPEDGEEIELGCLRDSDRICSIHD